MAKLKETSAKFDDLKAELTKTLDEIGEKLQDGKLDAGPGTDVTVQSEELKTIIEEVEAQKNKMEELSTVGEDLLTILDALDCRDTPKGKNIESTMQDLSAKYTSLQQSMQTKQKKLDEKIFQSIQQWVTKNKKSFNDMKAVSLDRDTLNEQIQNHRDLRGEIEARQTEISNLKARYSDKPATPANIKKYKTMVDNVNMLETKAKERGVALENAVQKLEPFHLSVYQLESWHSYAISSLKQESMDVDFLFTKIENVFKQRKEKEEHLASVKDLGGALVSDENFGDKDKLETVIAEVEKKWKDMEESLVKLINTAVTRRIESFSKSLEKVCKDLESAEVPSNDAEEVTKQYTDHQALHLDLKKTQKSAQDYVNKCKAMYKELKEGDPTEIQSQWSAVQKEYGVATQRSEERLGVLVEAQPAQLSADIEMDEVLQEWIEVDAIEGEEKRKKLEAAKNNGTVAKTTSKSPAKVAASPKPAAASPKKKVSEKKDEKQKEAAVKKEDEKKEEETSTKDEKVKEKQEVKEEKKMEDVKKEAKKEESKKEESKKEEKSDKGETKAKKEKEDGKSKSSSSSSSSKTKSSSSSSDKGHVVKLRAGNRSKTSLENGIAIIGITREIQFKEVMDFVRPHVKKIGLVKFFLQSEFVFISLNSQREVSNCIHKLDGTTLHEVKVKVKKANVQFLDRTEPGKSRRRSSDSSDPEGLSTIFDTPHNGGEPGKKPQKKGVLTLEEIKRRKREDFAQQIRRKNDGRDMKGNDRGGMRRNMGNNGPNAKRKTVLTLTELRAQTRTMAQRRPMDMREGPPRGRGFDNRNRDDMQFVDSEELERERQRVRIEQERLERERLQAERERVALERERQKREMDRIMFDSNLDRRAMKRSLSPTGYTPQGHNTNAPPRTDGAYWMQPKRPMMNRDPIGNSRSDRRQINTTFNDRTLSHLRFDDMRPMPPAPPSQVSPMNPMNRTGANTNLNRPGGGAGMMHQSNQMNQQPINRGAGSGMPIQRVQQTKQIPQRWNNRQGGPSWM